MTDYTPDQLAQIAAAVKAYEKAHPDEAKLDANIAAQSAKSEAAQTEKILLVKELCIVEDCDNVPKEPVLYFNKEINKIQKGKMCDKCLGIYKRYGVL